MTAALTGWSAIGKRHAAEYIWRAGNHTPARCLATTRTTRLQGTLGGKRSGAGKQGSFRNGRSRRKRQHLMSSSRSNPTRILVPTRERVGIPGQERVRRCPRSARGGSTGATLLPKAPGIRYREAIDALSNGGLYCDLETVTDELREQQDDQWRVSVLLRRIGRKRVRAADFRWAAAEIRAWAKEHGLTKAAACTTRHRPNQKRAIKRTGHRH